MTGKATKHMPYYAVLDALQAAEDCALCELEARKLAHYFDTLFYENVNDGGIRRDLLAARGYCPRHAHYALTFRNGLATAIIYQDQVRLAVEFLERVMRPSWRMLLAGAEKEWRRRAPCPACRMLEETRELYAGVMARWLHDPEMMEAFTDSPGLCVPHALAVADRVPRRAVRKAFVSRQQDKYRSLLEELEEFVRKQDYRHRREQPGSEIDSWQRAVKMMVGP